MGRKSLATVMLLFSVFLADLSFARSGNIGKPLRGTASIDDGTMCHYLLVRPAGFVRTKKYPLLIFLHGRGTSAQAVLTKNNDLLTRQSFLILIPEAPDKFYDGFSWYDVDNSNVFKMDLERDEKIVKQLLEEPIVAENTDSSRVLLTGFSQGGRLSFYIGFRNPDLFFSIAPIGGAYMPDLLDAQIPNLGTLKVNIFHGTEDNINLFGQVNEIYKKLRKYGVDTSLTAFPLGHTYTPDMLKKVFEILE